jgi:phage tail sheath protein FI
MLMMAACAFRACHDAVPVDRTIVGVKTSVAAFVDFFPAGPSDSACLVTSINDFARQFGPSSGGNEAGCNVEQFFLNGGTEAWIVRVHGSNDTEAIIGDAAAKTGMYALEHVAQFNLLCLPRLSGATEANEMMRAAAPYCASRRAMLLMDVPKSITDVNGIHSWVKSASFVRHNNIALYFPGVHTPTQQGGMRGTGSIAGIIARTEGQRGVWKSPAGSEAVIKGVSGVERNLTDQESSSLNMLGVNVLRTFASTGSVVWGARTLSDDSDWKYVPVRRTALYFEESIQRGTRWAAFEPNGETLWSAVRARTTDFMYNHWRMGALQGRKPEEAFYVKCDAHTTTQQDIDNGVFNIVVGFAPLKPAEFVIIRIRQFAADSL